MSQSNDTNLQVPDTAEETSVLYNEKEMRGFNWEKVCGDFDPSRTLDKLPDVTTCAYDCCFLATELDVKSAMQAVQIDNTTEDPGPDTYAHPECWGTAMSGYPDYSTQMAKDLEMAKRVFGPVGGSTMTESEIEKNYHHGVRDWQAKVDQDIAEKGPVDWQRFFAGTPGTAQQE